MSSFKQLGLSSKALDAVERMGYKRPTPVQARAIPVVLKGFDLAASAQTGTGKTGAFALPLMDILPHAKGGSGPLMLVITPTRELAQQIGEVCQTIALSTHHRITTVVGGLSYKPQIARLSRGTDVLIATPGRLIDLMGQKAVRLADVEALVLDEADRMLDMGFLPSVKKIVAATPETRQTLLFSATLDRSITTITKSLLKNPTIIEVSHKGETADIVEQYLIRTPQDAKPQVLNALLQKKDFERVLVFTRTRSRANATCRRLRRAGFRAEAIHSDRSQAQRRRALHKFSTGAVNILTATDVLARGIDIDAVDYVINYDIPDQPEDYIHRIGRTGRAGHEGLAISFVTPETERALHDIERLTKQRIPELDLEQFNFEVIKTPAEAPKKTRSKATSGSKKKRHNSKGQRKHAVNDTQTTRKRKKQTQRKHAEKSRHASQANYTKKKARPRINASHTKGRTTGRDMRPGRAQRARMKQQRARIKQQRAQRK